MSRAEDVPVSYYMTAPVHTVGVDDGLVVAMALIRGHQISSVVVVEGGRTVGLLARSDLLDREPGDDGVPVAARMSRRVLEIAPTTSVAAASRAMIEHEVHQLVVGLGAAPLGVLSRSDLVVAARDLRLADPASRWATPTAFVAEVDLPVREVLAMLDRADLGGVLVVDGAQPVGVFGRRERIGIGAAELDRPIEALMSSRIVVLAGDLPLHRAAAQIAATGVELAVVVDREGHRRVLTPTDVVRALAAR
jgi:CBS domain-containing protein